MCVVAALIAERLVHTPLLRLAFGIPVVIAVFLAGAHYSGVAAQVVSLMLRPRSAAIGRSSR
jgi:hypothetical protein